MTHTSWTGVTPNTVGGMVIVEGVYVLRAELRGFFDFAIWIDCFREERLAPGLSRDGPGARDLWVNEWMPREDRYAQARTPAAHADLVIDGSPSLTIDPTREFVQVEARHPRSRHPPGGGLAAG